MIAVLFLAHSAYYFGWIIDDAFVSFRYAHHLAHGDGLVFNVGERVEGYTNFAWVLLVTLGMKLGANPVLAAPALGALSGLLVVLLSARWSRELSVAAGKPSVASGLPAALLLAATPDLAFYGVSGLETALFALLLTGGAVSLVLLRPRQFAAFTAAAFLTRPEAGLLAVIGVAVFALRARGAVAVPAQAPAGVEETAPEETAPVEGETPAKAKGEAQAPPAGAGEWRASSGRRDLAEAAGILAVVIGGYLVWKQVYFGSLFPNTLAAKPPSIKAGLGYVGRALPALLGVLAAAAAGASSSRRHAALLGVFGVFAVSVVLEGGDFMPVYRMLLPSLPMLFIAADRQICAWAARPSDRKGLLGVAVVVAAFAYVRCGSMMHRRSSSRRR
ncbi:MAG: hypothetical protein R3B70_03960 [Polyangiaceae bacterium]